MIMIDPDNLFLILPLAFLVGLCFGSFVTMASYRLPLGNEIVFKPSYCPKCNHILGFFDLFPLFSWLVQRGKCSHCKNPVSFRYPLTEILVGLAFAGVVYIEGLQVETLFLLILVTLLAIMIVTDFEHYIIPDSIQVGILLLGIAYRIYLGSEAMEMIYPIVTGLIIGLCLHFGYLYLRKIDALGLGDVKFLAAGGAWITVATFIPFLFLAGIIGIVTGLCWRMLGRGAIFPFGPALAISLFINIVFPDILGLLQEWMQRIAV